VPHDWGIIANSIAAEINAGVDGIVVAHGTDSLPYTAAAVSFMLSEVPIPVVFTGSLIPPDKKETDAIQNLYDSILFSAKSQLAGVYAVFKAKDNSRKIIWSPRLSSISPYSKYFHSIDHRYVGKIENGALEIFSNRYSKRYKLRSKVTTDTKIDPRVAYFEVSPGFDPWYIEKAFEHGAKGMILKLFHSSTACTRNGKYSSYSLAPIIKKFKNDILIFGIPLPNSYLFSWDNVPGNDSEVLLRFLRDDLDIGWAGNAEIHKSNGGKIIRIFKAENSAEITIDEKKEKATLKISDGRTHTLKVKKENGKLNIYEGIYSSTDELLDSGLIPLKMSSESAIVKLMWVLGQKKGGETREQIIEKMKSGEEIIDEEMWWR
jgi:preprotein translocase subunit YajC